MKPYPMIPVGQVLVVHTILDDKTAGGIQLPGGAIMMDFCVGKVVACGTGTYSITGVLVPNMVEVGDLVIYPKMEARGITFAIRKHLLERGITEEEIDITHIVYHDHVVAKLAPLEQECATFDRQGCINSILANPANRWGEEYLSSRTDEYLAELLRSLVGIQ